MIMSVYYRTNNNVMISLQHYYQECKMLVRSIDFKKQIALLHYAQVNFPVHFPIRIVARQVYADCFILC